MHVAAVALQGVLVPKGMNSVTIASVSAVQDPSFSQLEAEIKKLVTLLPPQGPITAFAFLNPLEGLEELPFRDALRQVPDIFHCEPLLPEDWYRQKLATGRITLNSLRAALHREFEVDGDHRIAGLVRKSDFLLSMLQYPVAPENTSELHWIIAESETLRRFRPEISPEVRERLLLDTRDWVLDGDLARDRLTSTDVLRKAVAKFDHMSPERWTLADWEEICLRLIWNLARDRMQRMTKSPRAPAKEVRPRDLLLRATGQDADALVHKQLVRFCAVYLDQGYAHWELPGRDEGFLSAFSQLFLTEGYGARRWLRGLREELRKLRDRNVTPLQSIARSLDDLGIASIDRGAFLQSTILALRGWAGMIWQTESRPDRVYRSSPPGTFLEFLAVRLILDRLAASYIANQALGHNIDLRDLAKHFDTATTTSGTTSLEESRAYLILQLAQIHGWRPRELAELSDDAWQEFLTETDRFDSLERRRIFHLAFERQLAVRALDTVATRVKRPPIVPESLELQIVTCIDAREESFRRHLEEASPQVETFGNAGFFCVPMYYRGSGEAHFTALCPVVIKPQHWIVEDVVYALEDSDRQRATARRLLGKATHRFDTGTRSSLGGALLTAALGPLATVPLIGRILFPRFAARMHRTAGAFVAPPAITRLRLEREEGVPAGPHDDGIGFTLTEMVQLSERSLRDIGLTSRFAKLVMFLGHGSNCLNNPHESAYHCGACSGSPGGANARALAAMLNDRRVRRKLAERGIEIPEETHFIGGLHNTASEEITFFDLELLPTSHIRALRDARDLFRSVAERNAHERCRRFDSAPLDLSGFEALRHVQERAEDLAQTRPEYGNCTNAVCFVGRRSRIRGLFLDRRWFMMSYDRTQDTESNTILARILGAVVPVCEGINLLYTLSAIDNRGWGAGTKLPHNVTSLLGVMDGAASDLRTGLPWQGIDIHEPVRLLFVIETTPEAMLQIIHDNPTVGRICQNGWAQLAVLDPQSSIIHEFVGGKFVEYQPTETSLPVASSSFEWYRGQRDHLTFAMIEPAGEPEQRETSQGGKTPHLART